MSQNYSTAWLLKNFFFGLFYGIAFVLLNLSTGFSIALPIIVLSVTNAIRNVVVIFLAPFVEELIFLLVLVLLFFIFKKNIYLAVLATGLLFGVYHLFAYQAQVGAMISAMIFRIIVCLIYLLRKSDLANIFSFNTTSTLVSVIVMHSVFNAYILNKSIGLVVVG